MQTEREDLLLECWFYRLAHYPEWREQALQHIETLLQQGVRSPNWDLSANIERAPRGTAIPILKSCAESPPALDLRPPISKIRCINDFFYYTIKFFG